MAAAKASSEPAVARKARPSLLHVTLLVTAAMLVLLSMRGPWWSMTMWAPQFLDGLTATSTLFEIGGDVHEIDELNHYIGMMKLNDAAKFERAAAIYLVPALAAMVVLSIWAQGLLKWALRLPLVFLPIFFLADLTYWLWYAGNHLDPRAALSATIPSFTPKSLGWGLVAQFKTYSWVEWGFWLGAGAAILTLLTLIPFQRLMQFLRRILFRRKGVQRA